MAQISSGCTRGRSGRRLWALAACPADDSWRPRSDRPPDASGGRVRAAPAMFSRRWATDDVPGISRMFGECCSSQDQCDRHRRRVEPLRRPTPARPTAAARSRRAGSTARRRCPARRVSRQQRVVRRGWRCCRSSARIRPARSDCASASWSSADRADAEVPDQALLLQFGERLELRHERCPSRRALVDPAEGRRLTTSSTSSPSRRRLSCTCSRSYSR